MKSFFNLIFLLLLFDSSAQNLIPNPSFEDTTECPWTFEGISYGLAINWFAPTTGSSDLIHQCSAPILESYMGFQSPNSGEAYAGIICYNEPELNREYISAKLLSQLEAGLLYYFQMAVSLADSTIYASTIGVYFGPDSLDVQTVINLNFIPQIETSTTIIDKDEWICMVGSFIATGNEKYITIGNFRDDANSNTLFIGGGGVQVPTNSSTAYYYIDDVYLATIPGAPCSHTNEVIENLHNEKQLYKIIDLMGKESDDITNTILIYIYDDGTTKKVFRVE